MSIESLPRFTQLTQNVDTKGKITGKEYGKEIYGPKYQPQYGELNYHQARLEEQKPALKFGIPTQEDMETVLAFQNGYIPKTNLFETKIASAKSGQFDNRGKLWEGYEVPPCTGRCELSPNVKDRADSIPTCHWEAYYA